MGLVTLDIYFLDGTKIEANSNKFSFVWAKSNKRNLDQLRANVYARLRRKTSCRRRRHLRRTTPDRSTPGQSLRPLPGGLASASREGRGQASERQRGQGF